MNIPGLATWFSLQMNWPSVCAPLAWEVGLQKPLHQGASRLCCINKIDLINLQTNSVPFTHTGLFLPFAEPRAKVQMEGSSLCLTPAFLPIGGSDLGGYVSMHKDTSMVYPNPCLSYNHSLAFFRPGVFIWKWLFWGKHTQGKSPIKTCWQRHEFQRGKTKTIELWLITQMEEVYERSNDWKLVGA